MGSSRRIVGTVVSVAVLAAVVLGMSSALASSAADPAPSAVTDAPSAVTDAPAPDGAAPAAPEARTTGVEDELLDRLDALDADLPADVRVEVEVDPAETWATFHSEVTGVRAVLDTLETDLRQLFVDADDTGGPVAEAVAQVARGWLDVREGAGVLQTWETADLAFPLDTTDDEGVATGADELGGRAEAGFTQLLTGRARHLAGYASLRELGVAPPDAHARLERRAADAETFDTEVRPLLAAVLGDEPTTVLVPVTRFDTSAPGVRPRSRSTALLCVDRAAYEALEPPVADADVVALAEATPQRADCTDLSGSEIR